MAEDQECTLSCLKGTQAEKIKVKADCHVLKNVNDKMSGNRCIANTGWILSDQGYVSLNKNFSEKYYDMSTFSKDGFYLISASVSGNRSNYVTSFLIKYKK